MHDILIAATESLHDVLLWECWPPRSQAPQLIPNQNPL